METTTDKEHNNTVFITVTVSCAFLPALNKSLHAANLTICMAVQNVPCLPCCCHHCWNTPPTASLCSRPLVGLHKCSTSIDECQWVPFFFSHGGIQWHTFASYALPCQMPSCQTAPLLPSVIQLQHVTGYWWEGSTSTAIPPASASDVVSQYHKTGGICSYIHFYTELISTFP